MAHGAEADVEVELLASATLRERIPPPTGVVSGPLIETAYSRTVASVSSGSQMSP